MKWILELVAKLWVCRFSGLFWPILRSFLGGNINIHILPLKKERKIGSKEPENRLNLSFATISIVCLLILSEAVYACPKQSSDFFLVILVDARQLDYSSNRCLMHTIAKHPSDWSKNGDVGHAWIYLEGFYKGQRVYVEGGHSGETGYSQPKYFEGVMNYVEYGCADPRSFQEPRYEPNPIKYLWTCRRDGFFQTGSGGHWPTYAIRVNLTEDQFLRIFRYIQPDCYNYTDYSISNHQCSTFVAQVGALAGLSLSCEVTIEIQPSICIGNQIVQLWEDPFYSAITIASPDILEQSLRAAVRRGEAQNALNWYLKNRPMPFKIRCRKFKDDICNFPCRLYRWLML